MLIQVMLSDAFPDPTTLIDGGVERIMVRTNTSALPTDIQGRSQTSYTAPCYGVVSHGAQIGNLWVFADHACRNKLKTNMSRIFTGSAAFYACFIVTAVDAGGIHT